jgi:hypothetical protein
MKSWRASIHVALFGTSMTLFMAAALFVLVGLNPKQSSFGMMPWIYAGISLLASIVLYFLALRYQNNTSEN